MTDTQREQFTEKQAFALGVYFLLGGIVAFSEFFLWAARGQGQTTMLLLSLVWLLPVMNLLCLRTRVTQTELVVTFGALFPLYRRCIRRADIASIQVVTYRPLPDYGGWGIRCMGRNVALNARGNQGVCLSLHDGRTVLIGSQRAEALAEALTT